MNLRHKKKYSKNVQKCICSLRSTDWFSSACETNSLHKNLFGLRQIAQNGLQLHSEWTRNVTNIKTMDFYGVALIFRWFWNSQMWMMRVFIGAIASYLYGEWSVIRWRPMTMTTKEHHSTFTIQDSAKAQRERRDKTPLHSNGIERFKTKR